MSAIFERQNDATAMTFLKASMHCSKQKLIITYYMIIVSLLVTLASIALRIWGRYDPNLPAIYSQAVVLISGLVLISNIFCSFLEYEFNVMSVNCLERYDIHVFGLPENKALMRVIPEQKIIYYARKFNRKKVKNLRNFYFKSAEEAEEKNISFLNIKRSFEYSHRLLLHVYAVFAFLWVGYAVMIFLIAIFLSARDTFIDTLINIFVPALSTISLIATSWRRYNEQSRRLSNAVKVSNDLEKSAFSKDSNVSLQSQYILRGLQDVRFNLRNNDFTVPVFMEKLFVRKLKKEEELLHSELREFGIYPDKNTAKNAKISAKHAKKTPEAQTEIASAKKPITQKEAEVIPAKKQITKEPEPVPAKKQITKEPEPVPAKKPTTKETEAAPAKKSIIKETETTPAKKSTQKESDTVATKKAKQPSASGQAGKDNQQTGTSRSRQSTKMAEAQKESDSSSQSTETSKPSEKPKARTSSKSTAKTTEKTPKTPK